MTKQINTLTGLTALSLLGMLTLQIYFLYNGFKEESLGFKEDVNTSIELVLPEMRKAREQAIHDLHMADLMNPDLIDMEWGTNDEGEAFVSLIDPVTKEAKLTYYGLNGINEKLGRRAVLDSMFGKFRLGNATVSFGITDRVDARREAYQDTVAFDLSLFRTSLDKRFIEKGISLAYQFEYVLDENDDVPQKSDFQSDAFEIYKNSERKVAITFDKPSLNIIKRMYMVIIASVAVVVLIGLCFMALMRTISKQRKLSELKDDFIDNVTHELLTPIATMKISLESLEREEVRNNEEKALKYLDLSKMELNRVSDIVHNVLHTSLHDQDQTLLKKEEVDVNALVRELLDYHQSRSEKELAYTLEELENPIIYTDREHFTNVLHNLIDNAIKYTGRNQVRIAVEIKRKDAELILTINDNGVGISAGHEEKIFEKFHRVIDRNAETIKGLGVGLYYVRSILKRMNGNIELLHSSPAGSCFQVSIQTGSNNG